MQNETSLSTKEFITETFSTFYFLIEKDFNSLEIFSNRNEFGIEFTSSLRKRKIIVLWDEEGFLDIVFKRSNPKKISLVHDTNSKIYVRLNDYLMKEKNFCEMIKMLNIANYKKVIGDYAFYIRNNLAKILFEDEWFDDA